MKCSLRKGIMRGKMSGGGLTATVLFLVCVFLLWINVAFLPVWITDPYTHSAYSASKQVLVELQTSLNKYSKSYGILHNFSDIATFYDIDKTERPYLYSFEHLICRGAEIGIINSDTLEFIPKELGASIIEIRWKNRNVTAIYEIDGFEIKGKVKAIFNLGKTIDEEIENKQIPLMNTI